MQQELFFYNVRGWIRTFIAFFRWPPIFVQGVPNLQNCCFLQKLTPSCALTVWRCQNLSVGSWRVCRVLLNTVKICRLNLPAIFLGHAEHWINVKFSFPVYVGNWIQYESENISRPIYRWFVKVSGIVAGDEPGYWAAALRNLTKEIWGGRGRREKFDPP